jgi:hypothetical protein
MRRYDFPLWSQANDGLASTAMLDSLRFWLLSCLPNLTRRNLGLHLLDGLDLLGRHGSQEPYASSVENAFW